MPRGRLNEVHVQRSAVEWLAKYYHERLDTEAIVSGIEARISKTSSLGSGRADGLIAAQLRDGSIYTISIEAKSSRTWKQINVQQFYEKMFFHAVIVGFLVTFSLLILGITTVQEILLQVIFPIGVTTIVGFCFINFSRLGVYYREAEVIKQAERYPANEKWIALSTDIYNRLTNENQSHHFEKICQKNGIGLIRVSSSTKSFVVVQPKPISTPKQLNSFLDCYSRAKEVRNQIGMSLKQPNLISSPLLLDEPERSKIELSPEEIAESVLSDTEDEGLIGEQESVA